MSKQGCGSRTHERVALMAYYVVLVLFLLAAFFPQYRVWGFNWWAYYPVWVPWGLFVLGAVAPWGLRLLFKQTEKAERPPTVDGRTYLIFSLAVIVVFGVAFYLLRAQTHFLGDGYTLLSTLASDNPLIKPRELGESLAHIWVKNLVGGDPETAALVSYQLTSISAGILFVMIVTAAARFLFEQVRERILFVLGLVTGGYMLLFFGYVENYSLFVFSVMLYSLIGLLVAKGKLNRWFILPPLGLAIFFHILGVTLIPSAVYLLLIGTRVGNALARLGTRVKLLVGVIVTAIVLVVFYHFYTTDYFFRFAIVPVVSDRFTVEGYTMFSFKHLVDYFNLLVLLLPGLPVVAAVMYRQRVRDIFKRREYRFLVVLLVSALGAVFVFDPKLGMPRDWDLFAFAGVPLAMLSFLTLIEFKQKRVLQTATALLGVLLGLFILIPRAGSQLSPGTSIAHFMNYIDLDKHKSRTARTTLTDYYVKSGDPEKAAQLKRAWRLRGHLFEDHIMVRADSLIRQNKIWPAISLLRRVIEVNPSTWNAWTRLGYGYFLLRNYDSALFFLQIANGMNPYNTDILNRIGLTYAKKGDIEKARDFFLQALKVDKESMPNLMGLAYAYERLGNRSEYINLLLQIGAREDAPVDFIRRLGDYYIQLGDYHSASQAYQRALQRGLDSSYVKALVQQYPRLQQWITFPKDATDSSGYHNSE
jgi:tetratricopeptide (TPR) repeat protein